VRFGVDKLALGLESLCDDLIRRFAIKHALAPSIISGIETAEELLEIPMRVKCDAQHLAADPTVEALDQAIGLGRVGLGMTYFAPSCAQAWAKAGVKQLPLSVSTWVRRNGKAAAASRRKARALFSVSSSLTAKCTEREHRSMAT
jgi:hypothetical protein